MGIATWRGIRVHQVLPFIDDIFNSKGFAARLHSHVTQVTRNGFFSSSHFVCLVCNNPVRIIGGSYHIVHVI